MNQWLLKQAPNSKRCEDFEVAELQRIQMTLFMLRDPQLDDVYQQSQDKRRMPKDVAAMSKEWEELNAEAAANPELARMHRDGHCHEAVMWYVHHLPESAKAAIKDKAQLPLLANFKHNVLESHLRQRACSVHMKRRCHVPAATHLHIPQHRLWCEGRGIQIF